MVGSYLTPADIARLSPATSVAGTDLLPIVQAGGVLRTATASQVGQQTVANVVYGPGVPATGAFTIFEDPDEPESLGDTILNTAVFGVENTGQIILGKPDGSAAGSLTIYSNTATSGALILQAAASSGNYNTTITNAALSQNTTFSIPNPNASTANFLISQTMSAQQLNTSLKSSSGFFQAPALLAGDNGSVGTLTIYPATAGQGILTITTANNTGNTITNINISAQTGARTYTVPDATGNAAFVLTQGTQTIGGALTISNALTLSAGATLGGPLNALNVISGSSGTAGSVSIFPTTAATGNLLYNATSNGGNYLVTVTNALFGQATTLTYPDPGVASASFGLYISKGQVTLTAGGATIDDAAITPTTAVEIGGMVTIGGIIASKPFVDTKGSGSATVTGGGASNTSTYVYYVYPA